MTVSSHQIRDELYHLLNEQEGTYDVQAITNELIEKHDLTGNHPTATLDSIDDDEFWDVVFRHALNDQEGNQ